MKNDSFKMLLAAMLASLLMWGCKPTTDGTGVLPPPPPSPVDETAGKCAKTFSNALAQCYSIQSKALEDYLACYNPLLEAEKKLNSKCEALCNTAAKSNDKTAWKNCTDCQITITPGLMELHIKMGACTDSLIAGLARGNKCLKVASDSYSSCLP